METINVNYQLNKEDVTKIFSNALQTGGIGYWGIVIDKKPPEGAETLEDIVSCVKVLAVPNESTCAELLLSGKSLYVVETYDTEADEIDGSFIHELNAENLAKGFASFIKRSIEQPRGQQTMFSFEFEYGNPVVGDWIIQQAIFNEMRYG